MGRRDFIKDRDALIAQCNAKEENSYAKEVKAGEDDGLIEFICGGVGISVLIPDLSEYPSGAMGFVYLTDDDADSSLGDALKAIDITGSRLQSVLEKAEAIVVRHLGLSALGSQRMQTSRAKSDSGIDPRHIDDSVDGEPVDVEDDEPMYGSDEESAMDDEEEDEDYAESEEGYDSMDLMSTQQFNAPAPSQTALPVVERDMNHLEMLSYNPILFTKDGESHFVIAIPLPIKTLSEMAVLDDDTIAAWNLNRAWNIAFLLRFERDYVTPDILAESPSKIDCRVVTTESAEFSTIEAFALFNPKTKILNSSNSLASLDSQSQVTFHDFLLSWSLGDLLATKFHILLQYRRLYDVDWAGAELLMSKIPGMVASTEVSTTLLQAAGQADAAEKAYTISHIIGNNSVKSGPVNILFQLLNYTLRRMHLASKYCLVCHKKTDLDVESLRPFVCTDPFCTFQYLQVGLGPSIEQEVLHNPTVVDLLVSFAYASTPLSPFPSGVGVHEVKVYSNVYGHITGWNGEEIYGCDTKWLFPPEYTEAEKFSQFENPEVDMPMAVKVGDYLVVRYLTHVQSLKVAKIKSDTCIIVESPPKTPLPRQCESCQASYVIHRKEFVGFSLDGPTSGQKTAEEQLFTKTIRKMPSVFAMVNELRRQMGLAQLEDKTAVAVEYLYPPTTAKEDLTPKFEPSAVDQLSLRPYLDSIDRLLYPLLRWIICSNRGHITEIVMPEQQIANVPAGFRQFRFVMGSPEKEVRFEAIKSEKTRKSIPTIFAYHGSPLVNWHSIIRTGLHYNKITHGRAYGNGIYHAMDLSTSRGYMVASGQMWPNSRLKINGAMSVNEIINRPTEYTSSSPYLVVQHVDWVQTRFLLVNCNDTSETPAPVQRLASVTYVDMDSKFFPVSDNRNPIHIPKAVTAKKQAPKKQKPLQIQFVPKQQASQEPPDFSEMTPPTYATTSATKALQKELMQLIRQQNSTTLEERGWELPTDRISNMYQWQIKLVGFDPKLPLAMDLKKYGLQDEGITLELRFGPEHPFTPPFVRVVKPKLLQFINGGGGHVTAGGSICMDLLTLSGWVPSYTVEAVTLQVKMALSSLDPKPARLDPNSWQASYGASEAISAYVRVAGQHGWEVPKGWSQYFTF